MNNTMTLTLAFLAGVAFGAIFFGGLWWTIRKGVSSVHPARWFLASLLLRMGVVLTGFHFVAARHWDRLLACLLGFLFARFVVMRLTRPSADKQARLSKEAGHAS